MDWISRSFEEHTLIWLLISTVVGGVVGSGITFAYEDVLRPWLSFRRDTGRLVRKYTTPLLRSAESLERRIDNLVQNLKHGWYADDEYYRVSTLFVFGDYLGLVQILDREFGFVPVESAGRGRRFQRRLTGLFRALTSAAYFRAPGGQRVGADTAIPRFMLRAIGEAMTDEKDPAKTMEFTDFTLRYGSDAQFRRWFAELDTFLRATTDSRDDRRRARLIAAQANLRALMMLLDPRGKMVTPHRWPRLLERLKDEDPVRAQLATEFADVAEQAEKYAARHRRSG